jgi:parvulin-like peptidyl-prolyl isomerase
MASKSNSLEQPALMSLSSNRILYAILLCFFISVLTGTFAYGHSGHTHEEKLRISLPDVVAKVNNQDIHNEDIIRLLKKTLKNYKDKGIPLTAEEEKITAKKLIDNEIGRTLLLQKGNEIKANISNEALDQKLREIKSSFKSDAIFNHELKNRKLSIEQYKKELKIDLLMQKVIDQEIIPSIKIRGEEITLFYEKNKNKFRMEKKARASVILVKAKRGDEKSEQSARQKIESISEDIKSGSNFGEMAIKHSEDSLASKGGDLGYFAKNQIFGAFSVRAFDMEINEVTPVFKTGLGFHILKLTDIKEGKTMSLDKAKTKIEGILRKNKVGKATRKYVESLKQKSKIKMYF